MTEQSLVPQNNINMDDLRQLVVASNTKQPTDAEMYVFKRLCESLGANPFLRDIHIVKYSETSPASFITGKDFFTKVARSQGAIWDCGIIIKRQGEKDVRQLVGTFMLPTDTLVGGWCNVHTKDGTIGTTVPLSDFNTGKALWEKMPGTMIEKCAIVKALRMAYPEKLRGAYSAEEMQQATDETDMITMVQEATVFEPSHMVESAKALGAVVTDVEPKVELETAVIDTAQMPSIAETIPEILEETVNEEMLPSILCPIHNESMSIRDGQHGFYYSHPATDTPSGWCNCSFDKPRINFMDEWIKAIKETYGEAQASTVSSVAVSARDNQSPKNVNWWMKQLAGTAEIEACVTCGAKGEVDLGEGIWSCIEHAQQYSD